MISWFTTFAEEYLATDDDAGETLEEIVGMLTDMKTIEKSSQVCYSTPNSWCNWLQACVCLWEGCVWTTAATATSTTSSKTHKP